MVDNDRNSKDASSEVEQGKLIVLLRLQREIQQQKVQHSLVA